MNRNTQRLADVSLSVEEMKEEPDYINAAVNSVEEKKTFPYHKCSSFTRSFAPLAVCWLILLVIIGLRIYFTAVISENNIRLTVAKWNLMMKIEEMNAQNQELEMDKINLSEQMQNLETSWKKLNTSRAQWIIDAYCPINEGKRQCEPCQKGRIKFRSNCYAVNDPDKYADLKTWEEARENCNGKTSDLVVVATEAEKSYVNKYSWPGKFKQYWIGLRAVDGMWKWIDGSVLTDKSWMSGQSAVDGRCVVSINNQGWKSVNCTEKNRWLCQNEALSV